MNQSIEQRRGIRNTIIALLAIIAVIFGLFLNRLFTPQPVSAAELSNLGVRVFEQPRRFEPVSLLDHTGKTFSYDRLQGQWSLVFFGFTNCPDICPATLAQLRTVYQQLEPAERDTTQVILASADPARDTPEILRQYLQYFSDDFIGLTGEFLNLQRFARQLNAAFQKVPGGGENYNVDHSAQIMLINPRGDFHGFIKPPFTPSQISQAIAAVRNNYLLKYGSAP